MTLQNRAELRGARRVVVKVGSSSISGDNVAQITPLVDALAAAYGRGTEIVLVSSGAIATGLPFLNLDRRPTDLATQQAAAAVGQNQLIHRYQEELDRHGIIAGQVLLSANDLALDAHRVNAQRAMSRLLSLRILPIVNENDTVATHEIRFGDNDHLASMVARLIGADALVLLSDIECLYTRPPSEPGAEPIPLVPFGAELEGVEFGEPGKAGVGTGGAATKASAARLAADSGTAVLITSTPNVARALNGENLGTWFEPRPQA
ncbi:glutamate 5-kinase [Mycetocola tolaasinivorans]|uniref:Glutamate 5-kinase n=1 Tax=Mycetocola tolaasinivorans TaxID=76635 RepID=A0A3L7AAC9_9MICO|nr:glutamate 5-kinase [Mycetocola tolaasinivorans]RLP76760.1 glutamate 5-kinase [Mycetocola tolaasinivorans]